MKIAVFDIMGAICTKATELQNAAYPHAKHDPEFMRINGEFNLLYQKLAAEINFEKPIFIKDKDV